MGNGNEEREGRSIMLFCQGTISMQSVPPNALSQQALGQKGDGGVLVLSPAMNMLMQYVLETMRSPGVPGLLEGFPKPIGGKHTIPIISRKRRSDYFLHPPLCFQSGSITNYASHLGD